MAANVPVAIVGSSGLRSVGIVAVDFLIRQLKTRLVTEIRSPHFPVIYQTRPSYAADPDLPGIGGARLLNGAITLPSIEIYESDNPRFILTRGYHANFQGQYEVAGQVLNVYQRYGVKRLFILAGCGMGEEAVCCGATTKELVSEMNQHGIKTGYEGPLMGFSGIMMGLAGLEEIESICLFGRSQPNPEDPELPDSEAARAVLTKLCELLKIDLDLSQLDNYPNQRKSEPVSF